MGAGPHWRGRGAGPSVPRVVTRMFVTDVPVVGTEEPFMRLKGGQYAQADRWRGRDVGRGGCGSRFGEFGGGRSGRAEEGCRQAEVRDDDGAESLHPGRD